MINNDLRSLWAQRLAEYESSGESIKNWCEKQGVRENQFYYWRKKLREEKTENDTVVKWLSLGIDNNNRTGLASDFIAVQIGQVKIEIRKGFNQHLFREIIQVLQTI
jgi:transposase-like protein